MAEDFFRMSARSIERAGGSGGGGDGGLGTAYDTNGLLFLPFHEAYEMKRRDCGGSGGGVASSSNSASSASASAAASSVAFASIASADGGGSGAMALDFLHCFRDTMNHDGRRSGALKWFMID